MIQIDVGQDHVHREIAPHQEDAVAEARFRRDGFGGDQEQPGRTEREPQRVDQPRHDLRQHDAEGQLPARGAERLGLDDLLARQLLHPGREIADHHRRDADGDQRDLGEIAEPERDEQDRQERKRRHHRDRADEGGQQRPHIGQHAHQQAEHQRRARWRWPAPRAMRQRLATVSAQNR